MSLPGIEPGPPAWEASTLGKRHLVSLFAGYSEPLLALRWRSARCLYRLLIRRDLQNGRMQQWLSWLILHISCLRARGRIRIRERWSNFNVFFQQIVGKDGDVPVRKIEREDAMTVITFQCAFLPLAGTKWMKRGDASMIKKNSQNLISLQR